MRLIFPLSFYFFNKLTLRRLAFYKQAFPFLDSASYVEMYFPFVASTPALFSANDAAGAAFVGTGSTLYNNDGSVSAVGELLLTLA